MRLDDLEASQAAAYHEDPQAQHEDGAQHPGDAPDAAPSAAEVPLSGTGAGAAPAAPAADDGAPAACSTGAGTADAESAAAETFARGSGAAGAHGTQSEGAAHAADSIAHSGAAREGSNASLRQASEGGGAPAVAGSAEDTAPHTGQGQGQGHEAGRAAWAAERAKLLAEQQRLAAQVPYGNWIVVVNVVLLCDCSGVCLSRCRQWRHCASAFCLHIGNHKTHMLAGAIMFFLLDCVCRRAPLAGASQNQSDSAAPCVRKSNRSRSSYRRRVPRLLPGEPLHCMKCVICGGSSSDPTLFARCLRLLGPAARKCSRDMST